MAVESGRGDSQTNAMGLFVNRQMGKIGHAVLCGRMDLVRLDLASLHHPHQELWSIVPWRQDDLPAAIGYKKRLGPQCPLIRRQSDIQISLSSEMPPELAMKAVIVPWKFYHESWHTPWTSQTGDFPPEETDREHGERRRQLKQELWSKHDDISQLLKSELNRWPWGYTIYRTVYTPESDIHWEAAVDAIRANIFATLDYELQHAKSKNEKAYRILRDGYRSLVFEDKSQLDGATIDQVAKKFKDFLDSEPGTSGTRFRWCLMIDERALRSFIRYPEPVQFSAPPSQGGIKKNGAWVTVVDPEWNPDTASTRSKYQGFVRCHLLELEELALLGSVHHLSEMIHWDRSTGIPWYEDKI